MRDGRLVDAELRGDFVLAEVPCLPKLDEARAHRPVVTFTRNRSTTLPFHDIKVEDGSTSVNAESSTDLPRAMKRSECMGDARHKKSPVADDEEEDVTPQFRAQARAIMRANKFANAAHGNRVGDADYLIDDDVQLAIAVIGTEDGKTQIANLLGPVRPTTKPRKLIDRSVYVKKIRRALKMTEPISVSVDPNRRHVVTWIASLPDSEFLIFENAYKAALRKRQG